MRDYYMQLMWRAETFEQAVNKGGMDSLEAANARIEQILREHKPVPLDADKSKGLSAIVNEFGKS
jgi:trimethylamine:corrinoid methyltransferase-like protein